MKITHAEMEFDGRLVTYSQPEADDNPFEGATLVIGVSDFDDARDLLATLERSAARKRAEKKDSPAAAAASPATSSPGAAARGQEAPSGPAAKSDPPSGEAAGAGRDVPHPAKPPPCCIAPTCVEEATVIREPALKPELCAEHGTAPMPEVAKWRYEHSTTPKAEGKRRAREIAERVA